MADDPIDSLAVGLAEDHQAAKRRRSRKPEAEAAGTAAGNEAAEAGATSEEAEALATVVGDAADDAIEGDTADDDRPYVPAERIENIGATADIQTATMVGDIRDTFIDLFKTRPKPWSAMTEDEQRQVAAALTHAARDVVTTAVQLISEAGNGAFMAKLEKYADGGGLKINLTAESTTDNVLACHAAQGQFVMVSRYDPKPYSGERKPVEVEPDEPEMTFDQDGDKPPAVSSDGDADLADPFANDADPSADADAEE